MPNYDKGKLVRGFAAVLGVVAAVFLAGCELLDMPVAEKATAPPGSAGSPPVAVEKLSGPVLLAPSLTGTPAAQAAPPPVPAVVKPVAAAAAAVRPAAGVETAAPAATPSPCPAGTIGVWSDRDVIGSPVFVCRRPGRSG